jgi:hypothetical protein
VDRGDGVGGEETFGLAGFHGRTNSRAGSDVWLAIKEHVENNVGIKQEALLQRYFLTRCLR